MGVYFTIFGILFLFSFIEVFSLKKTNGVILFLILSLFLYLLSFLRWETGTDWPTYIDFFNNSSQWFRDTEFEWGFSRINEFCKIIFNNYTILLFFLASVLFIFQSKAILKFSPYPITSLFSLWSIYFGNVFFIRQTVATVILFYSVKFIQERKLYKFLLMVGLAMIFHRTSIIFLLAWFVYRINIKPIWLIFYIVVSVLFSVIVGKIIESLGAFMGGVIQTKLDFYLADSDSTFGAETSLVQIIIRGFANKIFIFVISIIFLKRIEKKDPEFQGYLNLYWAGIILYFSTVSISVALVRLSFAYDILCVIIIAIVLKNITDRYLKLMFFIMFSLYLAARLYISITGSYYDFFVPFKTIFNK